MYKSAELLELAAKAAAAAVKLWRFWMYAPPRRRISREGRCGLFRQGGSNTLVAE